MNSAPFLFLILLSLVGCASQSPFWTFDQLDASLSTYTCAKLSYSDLKHPSPLHFEMARIGSEIAAYVNLFQYRLQDASSILVTIQSGDVLYEEQTPLLEGRMRLRLSEPMIQRIISALEEGKSVQISIDGFEETLQSGNFVSLYQKLVKNTLFLQNITQGRSV